MTQVAVETGGTAGVGRARADRAHAALVAVRLAYGVLLLLVPAAGLPTGPADRAGRVVARMLGARHLGQGVGTALAPRLVTPQLNALVDGSHAASMVAWAVLDRGHRRPALLNAASAALFVAAEVLVLRRPVRT